MSDVGLDTFNTKYLIVLIASLGTAFILDTSAPNLPPIVKALIIPLIVGYITLQLLNWLFPHLDTKGRNIISYLDDKASSSVNTTNYVQVLPLFLIVMGLFLFVLSKF